MKKDWVLYRGVGDNTAAKMIRAGQVGDLIDDPCYKSFTFNPRIAWKFAKKPEKTNDEDAKVFLRLITKGGEKGCLGNGFEEEMVLPRTQKLRIVNISKANMDWISGDLGGTSGTFPTPVYVYDVEYVDEKKRIDNSFSYVNYIMIS